MYIIVSVNNVNMYTIVLDAHSDYSFFTSPIATELSGAKLF